MNLPCWLSDSCDRPSSFQLIEHLSAQTESADWNIYLKLRQPGATNLFKITIQHEMDFSRKLHFFQNLPENQQKLTSGKILQSLFQIFVVKSPRVSPGENYGKFLENNCPTEDSCLLFLPEENLPRWRIIRTYYILSFLSFKRLISSRSRLTKVDWR